jgi:hypothetical protein
VSHGDGEGLYDWPQGTPWATDDLTIHSEIDQ